MVKRSVRHVIVFLKYSAAIGPIEKSIIVHHTDNSVIIRIDDFTVTEVDLACAV